MCAVCVRARARACASVCTFARPDTRAARRASGRAKLVKPAQSGVRCGVCAQDTGGAAQDDAQDTGGAERPRRTASTRADVLLSGHVLATHYLFLEFRRTLCLLTQNS